ncbi:hypothetical protein LSCM1_08117 [Leishmania martiniquensis]|uniref:Uncharacterized protein n=1 Tax=Leishmania martiniquensis TaxID=1580590 RepID=A0A836I0F0_9TRYP|nr:hypothetical protein LSCM1_08117 [Leishmania martiniquensis]
MEVLSEAAPITNGEVYALLRRRRDERNAARHPPFGLQPALAGNQPRGAVGAAAAAAPSAAASVPAVSGAASALSSNSSTKAVPAGAVESASAVAAASATSLLASPSSRHLVVLLTEVTMLSYLANNSALLLEPTAPAPAGAHRRTGTPRDLYGPTSVYNRVVGERTADGAVAGATKRAVDAQTDMEIMSSCYAKMSAHRPGTRGHVRAVAQLLEHFEEVGRAQERFYAAGVRRVVQQLWRRRLWVPAGGPYPPPSPSSAPTARALSNGSALVKTEPVTEEGVDSTPEALQRSLQAAQHWEAYAVAATGAPQDRIVRRSATEDVIDDAEGARSTSVPRPLALLLLEPTPLWGPAVRCSGGKRSADADAATVGTEPSSLSYREQLQVQQASRSLLSEAEVLQLVVGRPQRALDVYRLLDDVDGRLRDNEEAVNAFVEALTAVFAE